MDIPVEAMIKLSKFQPREYQIPILAALGPKKYKRVLAVLPRRSGKDVVAFNWCIHQCLKKPAKIIYYIFPTYSQAKKVIWDSLTKDGQRFLDFIPAEVVESMNTSDLKVRFKNGSLLQLLGSDNYDSLMGTNPSGCVFSEYALQDPQAYLYLNPALTANDGWALFLSTPRGKNHLWDLMQIAQSNPNDWFVYKLDITQTNHIPLHEIERERAEGIMSDDLIAQEYYCSFEKGVEGSYYAKYLDKARLDGRISFVPYQPGKTFTAWDLGMADPTCVIFFQIFGQSIHIFDCYENKGVGLEHYSKILLQKEYQYTKHFFPHDISVREQGTGLSRKDVLSKLGIPADVLPLIPLEDGIENVRRNFPKMWIDQSKCAPLLRALENYGEEWDNKRKVYQGKPRHDQFSHWADAFRYLCMALPRCTAGQGMSGTEMVNKYKYGSQNSFAAPFRDPNQEGW